MASFVITAPDGKQYKINAPEGKTKEDALAHFKSQYASMNGGGTAPVTNPQGASAAAPQEQASVTDTITAGIRGLPFANEIGAAAATIPAAFTSGKSIGATYDDILGTEEMKEKEFADANPTTATVASGVGKAAGIGLSGALALKGASALSKARKGSSALKNATEGVQAGKRYRGGKVMGDVVDGGLPKAMGRGEATLNAAGVGALLDDDAIEGAGTGAAAMNLLFNTPAGRLFTLAMSRKTGAGKLTTAAWHGMNRQNRRAIMDMFKSFTKKGAK